MAVVGGESGMGASQGILDGSGSGNIALAISFRILKILYDGGFAYKTATVRDMRQVDTGSVSYQIPEILQAQDYGTGTSAFQQLNSGLVEIPVNLRRTVKYVYEQFDYARLGVWKGVVGVIAASVAATIQNDLNSAFWTFLTGQFDLTNGTLRAQNLTVTGLFPDISTVSNISTSTAPQAEDVRQFIWKLQALAVKINQTFTMTALGIKKSELLLFVAPIVDTVIRQAYYSQPNSLAERIVAKDLVGYQLGGGIYYFIDKMLGNKIDAGTSFSADTSLDTSSFMGFFIHNEAVAMPFSYMGTTQVIDQDTANPRFISKYQYGLGILRPTLIYSITTSAPAA